MQGPVMHVFKAPHMFLLCNQDEVYCYCHLMQAEGKRGLCSRQIQICTCKACMR